MFEFLKGNPRDKWLMETVKYYRGLGFFADLSKMKDKQLVEQIKKRIKADVGPSRDFDGLEAVVVDTKRVWKHAPVDITKDPNFWLRALDEWTKISRGILRPLKINIDPGAGPGGTTLVQFTQDSMVHSLYVHSAGQSWLDQSVFDQLNEIFGHTGFHFETGDLPDGSKVVIVATPSEKTKLMKDRNWRFIGG